MAGKGSAEGFGESSPIAGREAGAGRQSSSSVQVNLSTPGGMTTKLNKAVCGGT